ncbi:MAG: hypothetical protein J3K34DRAFT_522504 [Monoraphidium minutum]|nr:MAG: hypothetical protein J3K34DRAFT_522504 [Monoraphidium minutum]
MRAGSRESRLLLLLACSCCLLATAAAAAAGAAAPQVSADPFQLLLGSDAGLVLPRSGGAAAAGRRAAGRRLSQMPVVGYAQQPAAAAQQPAWQPTRFLLRQQQPYVPVQQPYAPQPYAPRAFQQPPYPYTYPGAQPMYMQQQQQPVFPAPGPATTYVPAVLQQQQPLPAVLPPQQQPQQQPQPQPQPQPQQPQQPQQPRRQQQQQQPAAAVPKPPRAPKAHGSCAFSDAPLPGSPVPRSFGLRMIGAEGLPPVKPPGGSMPEDVLSPTPRDANVRLGVLVCLVSSGLDPSAAVLSGSGVSGCLGEHPLDPGGCPYDWNRDETGQGTHLASIVAGAAPGSGDKRAPLGVMPGVELYSVRVWKGGSSAGGAAGDGPFAKSRLLPYTACEGKLRGLQASNYGRANYRMVMLLDVQAKGPGAAEAGGSRALYPSEQEWIDSAARYRDDMLWVAPAGDGGAPAYPAALTAPGGRLLSVAAVGCLGKRYGSPRAGGRPPDLLAPGVNITGASPAAGPTATLTLKPGGGGPKEALTLRVAAAGNAAGRAEAEVALAECTEDGTCGRGRGGGRPQLCVLAAGFSSLSRAVCAALAEDACRAGLLAVPKVGEADIAAWEEEVAIKAEECAPAYFGSNPSGGRPPVLLAPREAAGRLSAAFEPAAKGLRAALSVNPAQAAVRSGSPQAAAWVAGAAARLMGRYTMCNATDVAQALVTTAALLGPDGGRTGETGRGGLLQVADAEDWLAARPCARAKLLSPSGARVEGGGRQRPLGRR